MCAHVSKESSPGQLDRVGAGLDILEVGHDFRPVIIMNGIFMFNLLLLACLFLSLQHAIQQSIGLRERLVGGDVDISFKALQFPLDRTPGG